MTYDLKTTICGILVAISGAVMMDKGVFSPQVIAVAHYVNVAAVAIGLYFTNKTDGASKGEPHDTSQS